MGFSADVPCDIRSGIDFTGSDARMTQKNTDVNQAHVCRQEVHRLGMAEHVGETLSGKRAPCSRGAFTYLPMMYETPARVSFSRRPLKNRGGPISDASPSSNGEKRSRPADEPGHAVSSDLFPEGDRCRLRQANVAHQQFRGFAHPCARHRIPQEGPDPAAGKGTPVRLFQNGLQCFHGEIRYVRCAGPFQWIARICW